MNLPTKKIEIIIEKGKKSLLFEELQNFGFVEIISQGTLKKEEEISSMLADLTFARSFLSLYKQEEGFLKKMIFKKGAYSLKQLEDLSCSLEINKVISSCSRLEGEINSLKSEKENLEKEIDVLKKMKGLSVSSLEMKNYRCFVGSVKERESFLKDLEGKTFSLQFGEEKYFALIYNKKDEAFFKEALERHGVKEEKIFWDSLPEESLKEKEKKLEAVKIELEIKFKEAEKQSVFLPKIEALIDFYSWEAEKRNSIAFGEETRKYFRIKAWTVKGALPEIRRRIEKISSNFLITELEISEDDNPPVYLQNKGIMDSFGVVTSVYGLPKADEPDPTPFLALFFALFFGLALSDAGYGILLILFSLLGKRLLKENARFFNLLVIGGVFTVASGILAGTFFGTDLFSGYRILDPMTDPIGTLIFMLALGAFQIFIGLLIGMAWSLKQGDIKGALGDKGGSIIFFIAALLSILTGNFVFAVIGGVLLFGFSVLFSPQKGLFKVVKGFSSLYGLIGYFSDILSYSRLLALGLATGIIAMVINMIAFLFKDMVPIPGINWAVAIGVLVFGHTANLMINTLGSFIHSARLQFVEFFSKFMEGGGKYFKPLNKKGRFVEIIN